MTSLEEIKTKIKNETDWVKIGAKANTPILSIFSDEIKNALSELKYIPGKKYLFQDADFDYKIENDGKTFIVFMKPIVAIKKKTTTFPEFKFDYDIGLVLIIITLIIFLTGIILFSEPIIKAFFG